MTEADVTRGLRLIRYGGLVVTITVFVVLFAFALIVPNAIDAQTGAGITGQIFGTLLPYILGLTVATAVLSVVLYFAYRMYATGRVKSAQAQPAKG